MPQPRARSADRILRLELLERGLPDRGREGDGEVYPSGGPFDRNVRPRDLALARRGRRRGPGRSAGRAPGAHKAAGAPSRASLSTIPALITGGVRCALRRGTRDRIPGLDRAFFCIRHPRIRKVPALPVQSVCRKTAGDTGRAVNWDSNAVLVYFGQILNMNTGSLTRKSIACVRSFLTECPKNQPRRFYGKTDWTGKAGTF